MDAGIKSLFQIECFGPEALRRAQLAAEENIRKEELHLRGLGYFDGADALRQIADCFASGMVHMAPDRGFVWRCPNHGGMGLE